ncbi:hypothetical protein BG09_5826 [Bacillus thuringiensis serovar kurstaki str. HD-1]|nr:hypothetical protein bthur0006_22160 [Bacillus thuringiensis serovar kurstaki str. T03a001]KEH45374.1 hypothetical protein BG09_5826 [Bacillus thuringiensis serovar kurstaki str. HD-1]KLA07895.1 hypothetical protein B4158_2356 [Bacillus cereus]
MKLLVQTACWYYFRFLKKYTSKERGISHGHGGLKIVCIFI